MKRCVKVLFVIIFAIFTIFLFKEESYCAEVYWDDDYNYSMIYSHTEKFLYGISDEVSAEFEKTGYMSKGSKYSYDAGVQSENNNAIHVYSNNNRSFYSGDKLSITMAFITSAGTVKDPFNILEAGITSSPDEAVNEGEEHLETARNRTDYHRMYWTHVKGVVKFGQKDNEGNMWYFQDKEITDVDMQSSYRNNATQCNVELEINNHYVEQNGVNKGRTVIFCTVNITLTDDFVNKESGIAGFLYFKGQRGYHYFYHVIPIYIYDVQPREESPEWKSYLAAKELNAKNDVAYEESLKEIPLKVSKNYSSSEEKFSDIHNFVLRYSEVMKAAKVKGETAKHPYYADKYLEEWFLDGITEELLDEWNEVANSYNRLHENDYYGKEQVQEKVDDVKKFTTAYKELLTNGTMSEESLSYMQDLGGKGASKTEENDKQKQAFEDAEKIITNIAKIYTTENRDEKPFVGVLQDINAYSPFDDDISDEETEKVTGIASTILSLITNLGMMVAVIMVAIMGLKYMIGSAEEKADYKKDMIPYLVGASLLFGITSFVKVLQLWGENINKI